MYLWQPRGIDRAEVNIWDSCGCRRVGVVIRLQFRNNKARKSESGVGEQRRRESMLIVDHNALVVIGREPGVCDSNAAEGRPAARDTVSLGSIKICLKITELPEHNGF